MKKLVKMLIIVVIISSFSFKSSAKEVEEYIEDFKNILPDSYIDTLDSTEKMLSFFGPDALLKEGIDAIRDEDGLLSSFFLTALSLALMLSVSSLSSMPSLSVSHRGVGLIASVSLGAGLLPLFVSLSEAISEASAFFSSFIPIATAVSLGSGASLTASAGAVGMGFTLSVVGGTGGMAMITISSLCLALGMISPLGSLECASLLRSLRSLFFRVLGLFTAILVGSLSLQSVLTAAADSAALRSARYVASGMIPIVGTTVAGALSTLVSGMSYVKSVVGVGAVLVIASVFLPPLITLLLYRLAIGIASSVSESLSGSNEPFSSVCSALDMLTTVYSLSALIYIFEIVLFIKGGVSIG